jgi:hypothetical protein
MAKEIRRRIPSISLYAGSYDGSGDVEFAMAQVRRYRDAVLEMVDEIEAGKSWPPRPPETDVRRIRWRGL